MSSLAGQDRLIGSERVERVSGQSKSPLELILSRFGRKPKPTQSDIQVVSCSPLARITPPEVSADPPPYLHADGTLIIPLNTHPRYRYWESGQPIATILKELGASPEVFRRYVDQSGPSILMSDERGRQHE